MSRSYRTRKKNTHLLISLTVIWVAISIYISTLDVLIGLFLIVFALIGITLWLRRRNPDEEKHISDSRLLKINKQNKNRGRTIYVQTVDNDGCDLPEDVVQQKLYEARRNAEPRDNIVTVRHKVQ